MTLSKTRAVVRGEGARGLRALPRGYSLLRDHVVTGSYVAMRFNFVTIAGHNSKGLKNFDCFRTVLSFNEYFMQTRNEFTQVSSSDINPQ